MVSYSVECLASIQGCNKTTFYMVHRPTLEKAILHRAFQASYLSSSFISCPVSSSYRNWPADSLAQDCSRVPH